MAQNETYTTPEGITVKLPKFWIKNNNSTEGAGVLRTDGGHVVAEKEVDLALLTAGAADYDADRDNDGTKDGYLQNGIYIPANATIVAAEVIVREAAAGGTSVNIGLFKFDGTAVDADGLVAAAATAALTKGARVEGAGAAINDPVGADPVTVGVTPTGTFTAGVLQIMVKYSLN